MPWPVHPNGLLGAQGDNDGYKIERSLRFNSADSAYLNRTLSGTPYTYTLSWWVKRGTLSIDQIMFGSRQGASNPSYVQLLANNTISITLGVSSTVLTTTRVFRDPSAWYHFVLSVTPSATSYFYVNGEQVGSWTSSATPYLFNSAYTNAIGRYGDSASFYFDGYMAEINFIDGQALTQSSFGQTDAVTGRWKAKAYSGTYGANGFYLKFADNSSTAALGTDSSGNGNTWTTNNFSVTAGTGNDSLVDSPTNYGTDTGVGGEVRGNYATLSGVDKSSNAVQTNGNLDTNTIALTSSRSSIGISSGKWYCEVVSTFAAIPIIGVTSQSQSLSQAIGFGSEQYGYYFDGKKYNNGTPTNYGNSWTTNDVIGVALNMDSKKVWFAKNGTWQASGDPSTGTNEAFSGLPNKEMFFGAGHFSAAGSSSFVFNFGQRPFAYTAPTGFKALCTTNLLTPTIQKPSKYMDVLAYTGTGASNSISSLGFSPDLVWIKNRGGATSHAIYDTTRLATKQLSSDTTGDEATSSTGLTAFGSNGFTLGTSTLVNTSGTQYVAWAWDEAPIAGMDIVDYTGNGANRTIAHTLGVAPKMLIVKARTTAGADQGWPVWHTSIANTTYLQLNSTAATATGADYWNSTSPTSSVFSVGTNVAVNASADTYIAYVFAEVEGFSKIGSYTGNATADGTFVYCGFLPSFILIKSSTAIDAWLIYDNERNTFNVASTNLVPNTTAADATISGIDFVSNGFKLRTITTTPNAAQTYIFAAFAESPFKYARAR